MLILLAIAVGLSIETVRALFNDGRPLRPPASHLQDPLFVAPGRQAGQSPRITVYPPGARPHGQEPLDFACAPGEILQVGRHR